MIFGALFLVLLREVPLRGMEPAKHLSESFSMPRDATSLEELERIVTTLMAHEDRWRLYADLAERAQLDLAAPELWMLGPAGRARAAQRAVLKRRFAASARTPASSAARLVRTRPGVGV